MTSQVRPARINVVEQYWPTGMAAESILAIVNELPGVPVSLGWVRDAAKRIGVRRPDAVLQDERDPGPAVPTPFSVVLAWATDAGVRFREWDDLPAVNEEREAKRLHRFCFTRKIAQ